MFPSHVIATLFWVGLYSRVRGGDRGRGRVSVGELVGGLGEKKGRRRENPIGRRRGEGERKRGE